MISDTAAEAKRLSNRKRRHDRKSQRVELIKNAYKAHLENQSMAIDEQLAEEIPTPVIAAEATAINKVKLISDQKRFENEAGRRAARLKRLQLLAEIVDERQLRSLSSQVVLTAEELLLLFSEDDSSEDESSRPAPDTSSLVDQKSNLMQEQHSNTESSDNDQLSSDENVEESVDNSTESD